jgi:hypothetical protein
MRKLTILLWANGAGDWALEVDGSRYEPLSASAAHLFVRRVLMYAETSHVAFEDNVWTLRCFVSAMVPKTCLEVLPEPAYFNDHEAAG